MSAILGREVGLPSQGRTEVSRSGRRYRLITIGAVSSAIELSLGMPTYADKKDTTAFFHVFQPAAIIREARRQKSLTDGSMTRCVPFLDRTATL